MRYRAAGAAATIAMLALASPAAAQLRAVPSQPTNDADAAAGVIVYLLNDGEAPVTQVPPPVVTVTSAAGHALQLVAPDQRPLTVAPGAFARLTYQAAVVAVSAGAVAPPIARETVTLSGAGTASAFLDRFRPNEPIYAVGGLDDAGAKLQFSVALLPFAGDGLLSHVRLGYTQTFFWAVDQPSGPVRATTYSPEAFFELPIDDDTLVAVGYRHDSNGEGSATSVNSHRIIARASHRFALGDEWSATVAPSAWFFLGDRGVATDLADYYGYVGLNAAIEQRGGVKLALNGRGNPATGRGGLEGFLSYPVARFGVVGLYLFAQGWTGYGEALSDYNVADRHLRVGFSVTR